MSLCSKCGLREIKIQKRNLCIHCYQQAQKLGDLPPLRKLTFDEQRRTIILNLIEKYGAGSICDLVDLNGERYTTLRAVGEKYGVTRELVRQWYKKIFRAPYKEAYKKRMSFIKVETACKRDPRRKLAEFKNGSLVFKGAEKEKEFMDECIKRGFECKPNCTNKTDFTVNGLDVEVKSRSHANYTKRGSKTPICGYTLNKGQKEKFSLLACWHPPTDTWFIIPKEAIEGRSNVNISAHPTNYRTSINRYWEFQNAWHLLERREEVAA